jgi:hypothetical protein
VPGTYTQDKLPKSKPTGIIIIEEWTYSLNGLLFPEKERMKDLK